MPTKPIAITFDDGRADFTEHALPVLRSSEVPSTMYSSPTASARQRPGCRRTRVPAA